MLIVDDDAQQAAGIRVEGGFPEHLRHHFAESLETGDLGVAPAVGVGVNDGVAVGVVERPVGLLADVDPVEGRLREEDLAVRNQLGQEAVEEGEQQGRDVIAVGVGVSQDDDAVIAQPADVERLADAAAERRDDVGQLLVLEHLGCGCALDVQHLAAQGEDRLTGSVAALLRRAAGGVPLHYEELALATRAPRAIAQLARQVQPVGGGALARDRLLRGALVAPGVVHADELSAQQRGHHQRRLGVLGAPGTRIVQAVRTLPAPGACRQPVQCIHRFRSTRPPSAWEQLDTWGARRNVLLRGHTPA